MAKLSVELALVCALARSMRSEYAVWRGNSDVRHSGRTGSVLSGARVFRRAAAEGLRGTWISMLTPSWARLSIPSPRPKYTRHAASLPRV